MNDQSKRIQLSEAPKLEFEMLLSQLIDRAHEVMATQARLRDLISASNTIVSDLDLSTVLTRIAEVARRLLGAEYAAMGVTSADGHLEQFIHVGMPADVVAKIDHLPEGKGLLGALIEDPRPVRLHSLAEDQRSSGFPSGHPPMDSFLGVPIRVRDEVYGNLYLTNQVNGEFTADDEAIAEALAASAGIAVANARLFEESRYRERWSTALTETNKYMLANEEESALQILIERMIELAAADVVCIFLAVPERHHIVVDRAIGQGASELEELALPLDESVVGEVIAEGMPRIVDKTEESTTDGFLDRLDMDEAILVPFDVNLRQSGVLVVARGADKKRFQQRDLEMASSFADQVTLAVERSDSRANQKRVDILEDRSRIARDLHDHVIQRLFGAGLSLQAVASGLGPGESSRRIMEQIASIDDTIAQIRESIFALKTDARNPTSGLRLRLREVIDRVSEQLPGSPKVRFLGPVDLMSDREVTDDAAAVVTEALANIIRHATATNVTVTVTAASGQLSIDVIDDGVGLAGEPLRSGLANLRDRASQRGGSFVAQDAKPHGTHLSWSVPV
ncbi:MAG: GAF domain-containing protein [Aeromicrobium sp.]